MSNTKFAIALDHMKNDEFDLVYWPTIELALRIADKLMQEPSEAVVNATGAEYISSGDLIARGIWQAMRDAMLKEIEI